MSDTKTSSAGKDKGVERAIKRLTAATLGCCGSIYIDDTAAHTGPYGAIQVVGTLDAVLDQSVMTVCGGDLKVEDFDADITIPKGSVIYGHFPCVALVSGVVLAYKTS
jgi:hypothetical protein